ncbi:Rieske (2Fe-2S) protein [Paenibacillus radicis (ex Xue et al. 2023)]|uniref:Rieske 2Fe-2S domain-containing protein n=1 Tax=Paenibacillus radicis (ex Xue et al. 2023) TaxID=2972489 RepID=A0ABT1YBF6_9BACL|nr:Rieske 2Fe-2S domain-containing protein [Paenibacillus radicis (ex Xue et al. 2023)]MCR8630513.1 Rieske 2Fe-2S domain-containing protein [Paenibacillus radicis (ex Xue et al. 2023)]
MKEVTIGLEKDWTDLPKEIHLLKDRNTYRLVSRVCPHSGGLIEFEDGELVCFVHGWSFDKHTGACINISGKQLAEHSVISRNGELIVQINN